MDLDPRSARGLRCRRRRSGDSTGSRAGTRACTPACSCARMSTRSALPEFLARNGLPENPRDLLDFPLLLRLGEPNHPNWKQWFEAAGLADVHMADGPRFPDSNMAIEASKDGLGIALARTAHITDELATGKLVRLFDVECPSSVGLLSGLLRRPRGPAPDSGVSEMDHWRSGFDVRGARGRGRERLIDPGTGATPHPVLHSKERAPSHDAAP